MYDCNCRRIRQKDTEAFLEQNPHMLGKTWEIVSKAISGKPPVCNGGKGICTESATAHMQECAQKIPCPQ